MQYFPLNRGSCNAPDYGVAEIPIEPFRRCDRRS